MDLINSNHTQLLQQQMRDYAHQQEINRATYRAFSYLDDTARNFAGWCDYSWPSHEDFVSRIAWPGVEPNLPGGGASADDADDDDEMREEDAVNDDDVGDA